MKNVIVEVNTAENFKVFLSKLNGLDRFVVTGEEGTKSVIISEKENEMASTRIEMSAYSFPTFWLWEVNRKFSYNQALIAVINRAMAESTYINEVSERVKCVTDHRIYQIGTNENAAAKDIYSHILVDQNFEMNFRVSENKHRELASAWPIHPCSEKSAGDGILVLSDKPIYSGIGYSYDNGEYISLFPNKSNLPARLKSFMLPTSVKLDNPSDNIFKDGDQNTMECLVVFVRPGRERHVSGEVWIEKDRFRAVTFTQVKRVWYTETNMKVGKTYAPEDARIQTSFGFNNSFGNAISLTVIEKNPFYMRIEVQYPLNESRITSQSGLKGYSSVQENIGEIVIHDHFGQGGIVAKPDMVCGSSSIKGKVNQIRLSQAAYVAKYKYNYGVETLDSLNEELINSLAEECPIGYWSGNGEIHECFYGLVHVAFTDPSVQYSSNGKMGFQFEMTKLAMVEYPELASILLEERDPKALELVKEIVWLEESLKGNVKKGVKVMDHSMFNNSRNPKSIQVFRINSTEDLPVENYLLEEKRPAFVLSMASGVKVYIPSGKSLKTFCSAGANGKWLYDVLVVQLSRIFWLNVRNLDGLKRVVSRYILTIGNRKVLYPEMEGANLKQVTLYEHVDTVSLPTKNLMAIRKKLYGSEKGWEERDIYGIAARNPTLWRDQLRLVHVIDGGDCTTVGVSHNVIMAEKADNDGDLLPIYFGSERVQKWIEDNIDNQFETTQIEKEWQKIYYAAESDSSLFDDMLVPEKSKYKLYHFNSNDLKNRLFDAAIAKTTVGMGTTQYWAWSDAVSVYYSHLQGKRIKINGEYVTLARMNKEVRNELISLYAIILQEAVIGAIKHVENGAQGYQKFLLERMAQNSEKRSILNALRESLPFVLPGKEDTKENRLKGETLKMLFYVAALFSRTRLNLFSDLGAMYSMYNGGKQPDHELNPMIKQTTFYKIVSLIDEWREECTVHKSTSKMVILDDPF